MMRKMTRFTMAVLIVTVFLLPALGAKEGKDDVMIKLPKPELKGKVSLEEAIARRRSIRTYSGMPLSDKELSQLLWAAQGITDEARKLRAAPSAGATYPLETYVASAAGLFHYNPDGHTLRKIMGDDLRAGLSSAALGQGFVRSASAVIIFAAVMARTTGRYGKRGVMYVYMEAGHAAQNVHLQAVALGMGSVPVGAFDDQAVANLLKLPPDQIPLYLVPVGK
jgi:SagB-type dehydrogenase family enzyme